MRKIAIFSIISLMNSADKSHAIMNMFHRNKCDINFYTILSIFRFR